LPATSGYPDGDVHVGLDSQFGFSIINFPLVQKPNPTGLNRECNANFTVCKKQGLQFQTANTGMLTFMSDYTELSHPGTSIEKLSVYRFFGELHGRGGRVCYLDCLTNTCIT
jgi:hypothetical protein